MSVITNLNNTQIADKYFTIHGSYVDDSGGTYSSSGYRPAGAMGNIPTGKTGGLFAGYGVSMRGYATGDRVIEGLLPGKASITGGDNITLANARVKSGEFVSNVKSVAYYGADTYAAMNRRQIPKESFSGRDIDVSGVIEEIRSFREQIGPIISAYAPQLGKRDLQRLTKEALRT